MPIHSGRQKCGCLETAALPQILYSDVLQVSGQQEEETLDLFSDSLLNKTNKEELPLIYEKLIMFNHY